MQIICHHTSSQCSLCILGHVICFIQNDEFESFAAKNVKNNFTYENKSLVLAKFLILSLIVSIPRSSEALSSMT